MTKLSIIYGTRPEFLKLKILISRLKTLKQHSMSDNFSFNVIKINQHNNFEEDKGFYDFIIAIEDTSNNRLSNIGASILNSLPKYIEDSDCILAQGDTATVFYALLTGFQMKKKIIHLEAGLRTYDLENPYPEEGYRQMISRISDIHLCPSETEKKILEAEKVSGDIYVVGNTILDLVKSYDYPISVENKVLITLHRRENWDEYKSTILGIISLVKRYKSLEFYFIMHHNPSLQVIIKECMNFSLNNFKLLEPIPHKELIRLLSSCNCVITDSGGIQEEANYLGKHMYVLRKVTERNSIPQDKISLISSDDLETLELKEKFSLNQGFEYGDGNSCEKILEIL